MGPIRLRTKRSFDPPMIREDISTIYLKHLRESQILYKKTAQKAGFLYKRMDVTLFNNILETGLKRQKIYVSQQYDRINHMLNIALFILLSN